MILSLFWCALALISYTCVLFPALVFLRGFFCRRPHKTGAANPTVSLIIAAHNEEDSIGPKLRNIMELDYPRDKLEVIIASDGSTDGTNALVSGYANQGVQLMALPRQGKAPALNRAVEASCNEILVFSDANSIFAKDAIRALVRPFADPEVGGVVGNQCYLTGQRTTTSSGEQSYWNFDRRLKQFQSMAGNAISATGAIYAIRRSLFRTIPEGVTDDFVTSTSVIAQGRRLVFAPDASAYEPLAGSGDLELERKVRVITRGLRGVLWMRELLNPFRHGFYSIQLLSHKVLRRLMFFPLLALCLVSPLLWRHGLVYQAASLAQMGWYACAALGASLAGSRAGRLKVFTIPFFFCMVNVASLLAVVNILRGQQIRTWAPKRRSGIVDPVGEPVLVPASSERK